MTTEGAIEVSKPKYAHLHAWDEVCKVPSYVTHEKLISFKEKDAPEDAIFEICNLPEEGGVEPTGKFRVYDEITGPMKDLMADVFKKYGWGTP